MRTHTLIAVVLGSWIAGAVPLAVADDTEKQEAVQKELKKFEGTWVMVAAERNGVKAPEDAVKTVRVIIKGDKFTIKEGDNTIEGTIVLDPSKNPRAYAASATENGKKISTVGIYEFDGDTLKVCYTPEGEERPKEFSTKGGTDEHPIMLGVYKREKAK
jgi:uncharacterized protein (TIGR03067 family)